MLIDGKEFKILEISDLNSDISFSKWVSECLRIPQSIAIHNSKLQRCLDYISNAMSKQKIGNRPEFLEAVKKLKHLLENKNAK
jgi:hypothetical protein